MRPACFPHLCAQLPHGRLTPRPRSALHLAAGGHSLSRRSPGRSAGRRGRASQTRPEHSLSTPCPLSFAVRAPPRLFMNPLANPPRSARPSVSEPPSAPVQASRASSRDKNISMWGQMRRWGDMMQARERGRAEGRYGSRWEGATRRAGASRATGRRGTGRSRPSGCCWPARGTAGGRERGSVRAQQQRERRVRKRERRDAPCSAGAGPRRGSRPSP